MIAYACPDKMVVAGIKSNSHKSLMLIHSSMRELEFKSKLRSSNSEVKWNVLAPQKMLLRHLG
jgi:hypothetical protein